MEIINDLNSIHRKLYNSYLALGNFDGVHKGHRQLIDKCISLANQNDSKSILVTFYPHPQFIIKEKNMSGLLTPKKIKEKILSSFKLDYTVFINFSERLASLTPEKFIRDVLVEYFRPAGVIIGFNYTFGKKGSGNKNTLLELSKKYGFNVFIESPVKIDGQVVSSSLIRENLVQGNIRSVNKYLGQPYFFSGKVVPGEQRGRELGFPTANISPIKETLLPKNGVYSTLIEIDGVKYPSISNIGIKPTFGKYSTTIETHIFNFADNIYSKDVSLYFIERIRDEKRFYSKEELILQIKKDIKKGKLYTLDQSF